jgi:hypothetical protein
MTLPPPPYEVQRRAWEAAYMLRQEFSDRLTLEQNITLEVLTLYAPERLGWRETGDALSLWAMTVKVRV